MRHTYTVKHFYVNPRNNRTVDMDTRREALIEMRLMTSDNHNTGECSDFYVDGACIATRHWGDSRIMWLH